jgi:hypothetical protein
MEAEERAREALGAWFHHEGEKPEGMKSRLSVFTINAVAPHVAAAIRSAEQAARAKALEEAGSIVGLSGEEIEELIQDEAAIRALGERT